MFYKRQSSTPASIISRMKFWQTEDTEKKSGSVVSIIIIGLLFLAFFPYAGVDVWTQAAILALIFALSAIAIFRRENLAEKEIKWMLASFLVLAAYSFAQGLATLLVLNHVIEFSAALPYSFDWTASVWCALKFLACACFLGLLHSSFRRNIKLLVWSLIAVGNFFAVFGIVRFLVQIFFPNTFETFLLPQMRPGIGFGMFINQNHFAFLMLMTFGVNLGLLKCGGLEKRLRLLLFVFCLLSWTAIILTASRGGIISSFVEIAALILLPASVVVERVSHPARQNHSPKNFSFLKRVAALIVVMVPLIAGIFLIGQDRVVHRFEEIPSQLEGVTNAATFRRIDVWRATVKMIGANMIYGVGFGGFRVAVSQYIDISGELTPKEAHDDYLEFIASGGVIGAVCGVWFLYGFFLTLKKRFAESTDKFASAARIGAICAICGTAIHNLFDFGLQQTANWLFFAAIISIAVYRESSNEKNSTAKKATAESFVLWKLIAASLLLGLSVSSIFFGASRLRNEFAKDHPKRSFTETDFLKVPFDADFYETKGVINTRLKNYDAAGENFREAVNYRPQDYILWLELAQNQQARNQNEDAENSFQQAMRLAPFYGEPRFDHAEFLIGSNRRAEGFAELSFAFHRNPRYFEEAAETAWRETDGNAVETIQLLSPLDIIERERLGTFLFDKKSFSALASLVCHEEDLPPNVRAGFVIKLFEKRQFLSALQVYRHDCDLSNSNNQDVLADGDFESGELYKGSGFGWRTGDSSDYVKIVSDKESFLSGKSSLEFIFNGNADPHSTLISQIAVVEQNHQYRLSFAYRTKEIVTGGLPVLQLILKERNGTDGTLKETVLTPADGDGWIKSLVMIQTDSQTEALEIRLARQTCDQSNCPIFGRLWLDNFVLK